MDILELLKEHEPGMLRWSEITQSLWKKSYSFKHKNEKSFGVVVTNKLNSLKDKGLVKHDGLHYGTEKSTVPKRKGLFRGFFDFLDRRAERKRQEEERIRRELQAQKWTYLELVHKRFGEEAEALKDWVEIEKRNRKELGLDEKPEKASDYRKS
jgi:hypothetical protein